MDHLWSDDLYGGDRGEDCVVPGMVGGIESCSPHGGPDIRGHKRS